MEEKESYYRYQIVQNQMLNSYCFTGKNHKVFSM